MMREYPRLASVPSSVEFRRSVLAHRRFQMKRFSLELNVRQQWRVWGVFVGFLFVCVT